MKRYQAVEAVSKAILNDGLVEALFLKGSIARGEDDDYSDVDMYAVVFHENRDKFLARRIQYLTHYMPLVYWSESDFVGPQIVAVFKNALHFDLYTVAPDAIPQTDAIKILYDKNGVLASYQQKALGISPADVVTNVHEFTFVLLEFEAAYMRKDFIWSIRLFYALLAHLSFVARYIHDADNAQLALKRLHKVLPVHLRTNFENILENATPTHVLTAVKMIATLAKEQIAALPSDIKENVNMKFFTLMQGKIAGMQ
ncbi:MAG: nucleotidyltransferase domain-containing protein [Defluviitaleaceae bacterium]|nr:nucleotidyltransferase domain-containing protein [Defluviitaleaceae bacterium]